MLNFGVTKKDLKLAFHFHILTRFTNGGVCPTFCAHLEHICHDYLFYKAKDTELITYSCILCLENTATSYHTSMDFKCWLKFDFNLQFEFFLKFDMKAQIALLHLWGSLTGIFRGFKISLFQNQFALYYFRARPVRAMGVRSTH